MINIINGLVLCGEVSVDGLMFPSGLNIQTEL